MLCRKFGFDDSAEVKQAKVGSVCLFLRWSRQFFRADFIFFLQTLFLLAAHYHLRVYWIQGRLVFLETEVVEFLKTTWTRGQTIARFVLWYPPKLGDYCLFLFACLDFYLWGQTSFFKNLMMLIPFFVQRYQSMDKQSEIWSGLVSHHLRGLASTITPALHLKDFFLSLGLPLLREFLNAANWLAKWFTMLFGWI